MLSSGLRLILYSSVAFGVGIKSAGDSAYQISKILNLNSAEDDNLSPIDSKLFTCTRALSKSNKQYCTCYLIKCIVLLAVVQYRHCINFYVH